MKIPFSIRLLQPLATFASGLGKRKKLLIMIYHRVLDKPDFMRPGEVDKVAFTWHMQLLAKHFNVLPLADALDRMQNDTLPSRAVCITFDDGYADNYNNALPILQQFNLTATFFIANGFLNGGRMWNDTVIEAIRNFPGSVLDLTEIGLGQFDMISENQKGQAANKIIGQIKHLPIETRNQYTAYIAAQSQNLPDDLMMTSEQLKKLYQSGMEIGGHTVNHPILAKLDDEIANQEILQNKLFLEQLLSISLRFFAYPNGKPDSDFLRQHKQMVRENGYQAAVSTHWGVATKSTDQLQLPRFTPWDKTPLKFMIRIFSKYN
ncbi:polysaccharide deacetylase family protein [Methylomonas rivi]|uniref:Polysaccharide deacetylase family protein n=1 Tax=Methylomonas rivi TaxID=2952226 RepID=A0ABT1U290_9GAMM|nr:polysaccharide deacetylase family protein [Methylomonas sp. WSC-6]MBS3913930.1 polysaccharide deacetylase family protein [Bacteroidota bacterium]MCQ8127943.1 polysaccharide deacetylase family protein [Methylomonas sp. WSC-6]